MNELVYKIALTMVPKVGPITGRLLMRYAGTPEELFKSSKRALLKIPGIGPAIAAAITAKEILHAAERELEIASREGIQPVFYTDAGYPQRLQHYPDSPLMLFFKGAADLNPARCISVIGTRKPSHYGVGFCEEFLLGVRHYSPTIISGLAYGIDVVAHKKAMELGLPTIGVVAHGLGNMYPADHRAVARRMIESGGLLSEYSFHTPAEKEYFPLRNRIVAGLCDALLVVETGTEGGSLITAQFANEYHKDVFAVPGRVKDATSAGCNLLIKTHRANLVESPLDFIQAMRWDEPERKQNPQQALFPLLEPEEQKIVDLLSRRRETGMDELAAAVDIAQGDLASRLLELELKGLVKSLPGKRFALL